MMCYSLLGLCKIGLVVDDVLVGVVGVWYELSGG